MIGIVDYGRGNLRSVEKALEKLQYPVRVLENPAELEKMRGIILPGVGAFADAMAALKQKGWLEPMEAFVKQGKPFLGICLGMQLLFQVGEEHGAHQGLGYLPGRVVRFPEGPKVPHMGWNTLKIRRANPLSGGIPAEAFFYFVHSYYAVPARESCVAGTSFYDLEFAALVGEGNIWGTQFHPEKSSPWGLTMLDNFGKWVMGHEAVSGH